jgi:hypothetical protein
MRRVCFAFLIYWSAAAQGQDAELGARYWYSQSKTTRSHNGQVLFPSLGNPTSVLAYEDLNAHAVELYGRRSLGERWFIKGNAGLGTITRGSLDDEDFNAGQVKSSDTTSAVKGNRLTYVSIDVGRDLWQFGNSSAGLFIGYHFWRERLDAYGVDFTVVNRMPLSEADRQAFRIPESVPAITNDVTWQSLRIGFAATSQISPRTRFALDAAFVPYAHVRDEDSHWLRQDPSDPAFFLGPAPNIFIEGRGYGLQLEADLRHVVARDWELGAGLRHWWLRARSGTREAVGISVPLREIESQRTGLTLSLTRRW